MFGAGVGDHSGRLMSKHRGEPVGGSPARLALQADTATHQLDQLRRNREAEAGAAAPPRDRRVGLGERLKNIAPAVERYADTGVADLKAQNALACVASNAPDVRLDRAVASELERI